MNSTICQPLQTSPASARRPDINPSRTVAPTGIGVRAQSRPSAATFRRRRVAASVFGLGLVLVTAHTASASSAGSAAGGGSRAHRSALVQYHVRAGDTLWSIARQLAPNDDPRAVVDLLVEAHGGAVIHAGDVIDWAGR